MAEASNNIVPLNGSPLSRKSRENISAQISSFGSFVGGERNLSSQKTRADDYQDVVIQGNQSSIISLQDQINGLSRELSALSANVNNIALSVQQQSTAEQLRLRTEQENQRRYVQRKVAIGKESELERNIQSALSAPVVAVQSKVSDLFGRVEQAFTTLFLGWLSNSVIQYLQAQSEGNTKKLSEIQGKIIKGLGIGVASLVVVKTGISMVGRAIASVTSGVISLISKIVSAPFKAIGSGVRSLGAGAGLLKPPAGRGGAGGAIGKIGKFFTVVSGLMNAKSGENVDAFLAGLSLFAKAPGIVGGVAKIAGVAFTLDELAEAFGSNVFGDPKKDKIVDEAALAAKKELGKGSKTTPTPQVTPNTNQPPSTEKGTPAPTSTSPAPKVTPTTPVTPQANDLTVNINQPTSTTVTGPNKNTDLDKTAPSAAQVSSKTTMAYALDNMLVEENKKETNINPPAQIAPKPKDIGKIGTLPELQPNVIVATDNNTMKPSVVSQPMPKSSPNPDVPDISPSNPDNFYVLYSQLNYNVVI